MNVLYRPLTVAVCSLFVVLTGAQALGQEPQYLNRTIIEAQRIEPSMQQAMSKLVDQAMDNLTADEPDPKKVSMSRADLVRPLTDIAATGAFKKAFSELISSRMDPAVNHAKPLVRINAMIVLSDMIDAPSVDLIASGLEDDSVAVQRWAMIALRKRIAWLKDQDDAKANIDKILKLVLAKLNQRPAPHPITVTPALQIFLDVDTPAARANLVDQLNKRVAVHAQDATLSYAGEQLAIERFARSLAFENPFDQKSGTGLSKASFRFASLVIEGVKNDSIPKGKAKDQHAMFSQSIQALGQIAAGASTTAPPEQRSIKNWVRDGNWDGLEKLLKAGWTPILTAEPYSLTEQDLATD